MGRVFRNWYAVYGFALLCVGVAALFRSLLDFLDTTLHFAVFYPAILIAALYAGTRAGIFAIFLSMFVVWWAFFSPRYQFGPLTFGQVVNLALFALSSSIIVWVAALANSYMFKLKLAVDELAHRSKNMASVIDSIVRQSLVKQPQIASKISDRIRAITTTNDLIAASENMNVDIDQLLSAKLRSFDRIYLSGPVVTLSSNMARNISLIVHELRTNAFKYGALSVPSGRVKLSWANQNGYPQRIFSLSCTTTQSDICQSPPQVSRKRECAPRWREITEEFGANFAVSRNPETVSGANIRRIRRKNRHYSTETLLGRKSPS